MTRKRGLSEEQTNQILQATSTEDIFLHIQLPSMVVKPLHKPEAFLTRVGCAAEFLLNKEKCNFRWGFERWPLKCQAKTLPLCCRRTGIESNDDYNSPPCSSSDKVSSKEEIQITDRAPVYTMILLSLKVILLLNMRL